LDALRELERLEEEQDGISGLMDSIESEDHLQSRHRQNQPEDLPMMRIGDYLSLYRSLSITSYEFDDALIEMEIRCSECKHTEFLYFAFIS
jgi:hypothetical protein